MVVCHCNQVVEKELLIQEKEKLYMELKHVLARQPGPEVAEQLLLYQQTLKQKTKQLKVKIVLCKVETIFSDNSKARQVRGRPLLAFSQANKANAFYPLFPS